MRRTSKADRGRLAVVDDGHSGENE